VGTCISDMQCTQAGRYVAIIAASHGSCKEMSRSENFQTAGGKRVQRKKIPKAVAMRRMRNPAATMCWKDYCAKVYAVRVLKTLLEK
jgi:hypothetical protein